MKGVTNEESKARSDAFNERVLAYIVEHGPMTNAEICERTDSQPRALRAKLARMTRAGIIYPVKATGQRGYHVTYHAGQGKTDVSKLQQRVVRDWMTGSAQRDFLVTALFGPAKQQHGELTK